MQFHSNAENILGTHTREKPSNCWREIIILENINNAKHVLWFSFLPVQMICAPQIWLVQLLLLKRFKAKLKWVKETIKEKLKDLIVFKLAGLNSISPRVIKNLESLSDISDKL